MIPRYSVPEIERIFSDQARFETWLEVELVQRHALAAWEGEVDFRSAVEGDGEIAGLLDAATIERCFDPRPRFIEETFKRAGLE